VVVSIIEGSAIGPASYDVTASDLAAASPGNILCKYTDDTYVIIPAQNVDNRTAELLNIELSVTNLLILYVHVGTTGRYHNESLDSLIEFEVRVTLR